MCYRSGSKFREYRSLSIRWFNIISTTLIVRKWALKLFLFRATPVTYIYIYIYIYVYMFIHARMYTYVCVSVSLCLHTEKLSNHWSTFYLFCFFQCSKYRYQKPMILILWQCPSLLKNISLSDFFYRSFHLEPCYIIPAGIMDFVRKIRRRIIKPLSGQWMSINCNI